jgi:hypothetical protein
MRWVVGDPAIAGFAASASQMGRFETKWLSRPRTFTALLFSQTVNCDVVLSGFVDKPIKTCGNWKSVRL